MSGPAPGGGTTIFTRMSALAEQYGAVNLGQGFPDDSGPDHVIEAAAAAMREGRNQYPPLAGVPALREAIAVHQREQYGIELDPASEVLVTAGATEAITAAMLALVEPGDEVIAFEPFYDSYRAAVELAGGTLVPVRLEAPGFRPDPVALRTAIGERTRLILLNSPHNPTGTVFDPAELQAIADLAVAHDLLVVTDEVYEHIVFDGREHRPIAELAGMPDRTVTVGSAGKTFSLTGWKIGWALARPHLLDRVRAVKQYLTFASGTPLQYGIATALEADADFYRRLRGDYERRRDLMVEGLTDLGFTVNRPEGTYFVIADAEGLGVEDGGAYCETLPERCGVVAVPTQVFYADPDVPRPQIRFAFAKPVAVLEAGLDRLRDGLRER